jgi:2-C-methyl-D-erythritol 4-phosphate cytidylyltransferase
MPTRRTCPSEAGPLDRGGRSVSRVGVAVPAAGAGVRMGGGTKVFLEVGGEPLLARSLRPFLRIPEVEAVAVALPPAEVASPPAWLRDLDTRIRLVEGGESRLHSVRNALEALPGGVEVVLVHDAARPLVTGGIIRRCIGGVRDGTGAVAGWPVVDTLKSVDDGGYVTGTPDRSGLWRAQTPQAFLREALLAAYRRAVEEGWEATDDAAVFARDGGRVRMVEGSPWNLKVTHPQDLEAAKRLLGLEEAGG